MNLFIYLQPSIQNIFILDFTIDKIPKNRFTVRGLSRNRALLTVMIKINDH